MEVLEGAGGDGSERGAVMAGSGRGEARRGEASERYTRRGENVIAYRVVRDNESLRRRGRGGASTSRDTARSTPVSSM